MKKLLFLFLFTISTQLSAAGFLVHEAFLTRYTEVSVPLAISVAPPAPIMENVPPRPSMDEIWIPGYWSWIDSDNKYEWVCGVWRRPPPNHFWITGAWVQNPNGWMWASGFWSPVPLEGLKFINQPPLAGINEPVPASPGNNYFWVPGYWEYNGNYGWLSGKWELFNPSWILTRAAYYWRPQGYVFVPVYWDWPIEVRGHAFSCFDGVAIAPDMIINNLFFFYPDYHLFYWHWWHFHPGWGWDGCGCLPPWWFWDDWWSWGWGDSWGLWWWWGHPGFFPPIWLSLELSLEIAPPPLAIIDAFKDLHKPDFDIKLGDKLLPPKGKEGGKGKPKKPEVPNNVTPKGPVKLPELPDKKVTVPQAPDVPSYVPPSSNYNPPQGKQPPAYNPPQGKQPDYPRQPPAKKPPTYNPPESKVPPRVTPPAKNPPKVTPPMNNPSKVTPPKDGSTKRG